MMSAHDMSTTMYYMLKPIHMHITWALNPGRRLCKEAEEGALGASGS